MMKKQKRNNEDNRGVAIYARKSRITNKGDSIGVQFKQCAEYAKRELQFDDDYNFMEYEDKGLSGYYSDRPDFQRMLHDIEMGKIRAVVCYKLDRIGRKTSDLLRLLDFLEKHKVNLLICSNNINTASGVSKIFIQIFAVVAEFERDTLTERITDNMMELAKDGRWLGGNTPTGFTVKRVKTGSGKNKSAYSYLESIPEEKAMIQKLYEIFASTRSIKKTADKMNELGYRTKIGSKFNTSTTRLLLKNPVYCVADEMAYNYFYENGGGVCAELSEFDGQHGLSAYNKTDQEKFEDADSTFVSPKFVQLMSAKPVSEWIISVGRHEGFIPSQQWIDTQIPSQKSTTARTERLMPCWQDWSTVRIAGNACELSPNQIDGQTASRDSNMSVPAIVWANVLSVLLTVYCLMNLWSNNYPIYLMKTANTLSNYSIRRLRIFLRVLKVNRN